MRGGDGKSTQPHGTASVQGRKAQTYIPMREKEMSQPGREDHQAHRNSKGSGATESEEDRASSTCGYRCMPQRTGCLDGKSGRSPSPGSARRGRYVNPASWHSKCPSRKAQTYVPVRDKLRSQPGLKDHQAYRNSKGSGAT